MTKQVTHNLHVDDVEINLESNFLPNDNRLLVINGGFTPGQTYQVNDNVQEMLEKGAQVYSYSDGVLKQLQLEYVEDNVYEFIGYLDNEETKTDS